jgi:UDP-glucose 4-epimerase
MGSLNLIQESIKHNVKQFVFASTGGAIYGEISGDRLATENDMPVPISPYACSKFAIENYLKCFSVNTDMKYTILRYANVYGPRQNPHGEAGVVAIFANNLIEKLPIRINARSATGDDGCIRDYVYVSDVVKANMYANESQFTIPIINICTGVGISTYFLLQQLKTHIEYSPKVSYCVCRPGDIQRSVLDPTQYINILGHPTNINDGISNTAKWFIKNK